MISSKNYSYYNYISSPAIQKGNSGDKLNFNKLILVGNSSTNTLVNSAFDNSFNTNNAQGFINQVNKLLPGLYTNTTQQPLNIGFKTNYLMYGLPVAGTLQDEKTQVEINKDGHLQISHDKLQNILVTPNDLSSEDWDNSSLTRDIYKSIPGIKNIPIPKFVPVPGRTGITNKEIISGGVRFLDPWPQSEWEKTSLGKNWPPDPFTTKGPVRISAANYNQALFLDTNHPSCLNVGKTYGVIPKAIITVNPQDSSVTLAVQQENTNSNQSIKLAPWVIAPIKVPKDKKAIAAFPVQKSVIDALDNATNVNSLPDWLKSVKANDKWKIDNQNDVILIDPSAPGAESKLNTQNTNWAVYAIEGSDKAILMRSIYDHPDQFQAFVRKPSNSDKAEYLELEYTGPKVSPGNKSCVVVKWDFIPVSMLSKNRFNQFGDTGNLENEVKIISKELKNMINKTPV